MTYSKSVTLWCDGEREGGMACAAWTNADGMCRTVAEVRSVARKDGWATARPGGEDYCPECVERGEHL